MIIKDPVIFCRESPLEESLVLQFMQHLESMQVEIVYDYAAEIVSQHFDRKFKGTLDPSTTIRDFRRLLFEGVDKISCHGRPWPGFGFRIIPQDNDINIYRVVTMMEIKQLGNLWKTVIKLSEFGPYEFTFSTMHYFQKRGRTEPTNNGDLIYIDIDGLGKIDPLNPFWG